MPATLDGLGFRIDPYMVSWNFTPKVRIEDNIGGRVVQVYGSEIGPVQVQGSFGQGGWQEQQLFLNRMVWTATLQSDRYPNPPPNPSRFTWPEMDWDMLVWLVDFTQVGASDSVYTNNTVINPKWGLTFKVVEDNSGLHQVAADEYISRVAAGLGWHQTSFNGPMDIATATDQMSQAGAGNVRDFVNIAFGIGNPQMNTTGGASGGGVSAGTTYTTTQIAQVARSAGFSGDALVISIAVAMAESSGVVDNTHLNDNGSVDRGLWQVNSVHSQYDSSRLLSDPAYNANAAYEISGGGTNWHPWATFNNGAYQQYMDAARAAAGV